MSLLFKFWNQDLGTLGWLEESPGAAAGQCFFHETHHELRAAQGSLHPVFPKGSFCFSAAEMMEFSGWFRKWVLLSKPKIKWGECALSMYCDIVFVLKLEREIPRIKEGDKNTREHVPTIPSVDQKKKNCFYNGTRNYDRDSNWNRQPSYNFYSPLFYLFANNPCHL